MSTAEAGMADDAGRSRLGRGLAALMGDVGAETDTPDRSRHQRRVPIEFIKANPRNPRRDFSDSDLEELTASVRERGIIQPIVVRSRGGSPENYEIIAGERRWRSAQRAGLHEVPIVVVEATDSEALQLAIIENVQRADLNPIEEANGYLALSNEYNYSQEEIAKIVGKSRPHIANMLRLTKLSEPVKQYVVSGKLSAGHARVLLGQPNALEIAKEIVDKGLSVRQVEAMARKDGAAQAREVRREGGGDSRLKDADTIALEKRVSLALGLTVSIDHRRDGGGRLHIAYSDLDQLEDVIRRLERGG